MFRLLLDEYSPNASLLILKCFLVWHLNGVIIDSKDRFQIEELGDGNWSLTINDVKESDFGTLRCVATNEHGSDEYVPIFYSLSVFGDLLGKQTQIGNIV